MVAAVRLCSRLFQDRWVGNVTFGCLWSFQRHVDAGYLWQMNQVEPSEQVVATASLSRLVARPPRGALVRTDAREACCGSDRLTGVQCGGAGAW